MALSGSVTTSSSHNRSVTVNWSATQDISKNQSKISWEIVGSGSGSGWVVVSELRLKIDGSQEFYRDTSHHTNCYQGTVLASGTKTITHGNDGKKSFSISIEAGIYQWAINCSGSGSFTLNNIPRNLDSISISERGHGWNYIQVNWSCSPKRDWTQYSLNGGAWTDAGDTVASDGKSGWFNIGGLSENTKYTIKVRLRREDSQLWSESNTLTITTASGHTSITQFVVNKVTGRSDQLKITWAAGNTCDYGWYSIDNGKTWVGGLSYPDQIISNNIEDSSKESVNAEIVETDDYFTKSRLERDKMYSQMLESYQKILNNSSIGEEQKKITQQEILKINEQKNAIMITENLIKTKGIEDLIIFINDNNINIIVKSKELKPEQIAQIQNIVTRELKAKISNIHITNKD